MAPGQSQDGPSRPQEVTNKVSHGLLPFANPSSASCQRFLPRASPSGFFLPERPFAATFSLPPRTILVQHNLSYPSFSPRQLFPSALALFVFLCCRFFFERASPISLPTLMYPKPLFFGISASTNQSRVSAPRPLATERATLLLRRPLLPPLAGVGARVRKRRTNSLARR